MTQSITHNAPVYNILYGAHTPRSGLAESPLWDTQRASWFWIDIVERQIHQQHYSPTNYIASIASHRTWQLPMDAAHDIGAIALNEHGILFMALRQGIAALDPDAFIHEQHASPIPIQPTILIDAPYDTSTTRFNDGGVDAQGRWWIGSLYAPKTSAAAHLYCVEQGQIKAILGTQALNPDLQSWGVTTANGWAIAPNGDTLYHADTQAHTVYKFNFDSTLPAEHALSHRAIHYQTQDTRNTEHPTTPYEGRPDGAAMDAKGNYWMALYEGACVVQLNPQGQCIQRINLPAIAPTMVCFGGPHLNTLLITTAGNRPKDELKHYPANGQVLTIELNDTGLLPHRIHHTTIQLTQ